MTPFAISRLNGSFRSNSPTNGQEFDIEQDTHMSIFCEKYTKDGERIVLKMPLNIFRQCLVNHFDIRFKKNDITWPGRMNKPN